LEWGPFRRLSALPRGVAEHGHRDLGRDERGDTRAVLFGRRKDALALGLAAASFVLEPERRSVNNESVPAGQGSGRRLPHSTTKGRGIRQKAKRDLVAACSARPEFGDAGKLELAEASP
jgi:hypothetical protein